MQKLLFFALLIGMFLAACKRTEAPVGFNDPVFKVGYDLDTFPNNDDSLTAGLNNVYLFTRYDLSDNVFHSYNTFSDVSCPDGDCPGSLTFEFRGNALVDSAFYGPQYNGTMLIGGFYEYTLPDSAALSSRYITQFTWVDVFQNLPEQTFILPGNNPHTYGSPTQQISLLLPDVPQPVILNGIGSNGLKGSIERTIIPSALTAYPSVSIRANPVGNSYLLTAYSDWNGPAIVNYQWNTGDSTDNIVADSIAPFLEYFVTVTDIHNNTAVASLSSLPYPPAQEIRTPQLSFDAIPYSNPHQSGTVAIQWVDAAGTIWRSDRQAQPVNSGISFQVLESQPYEPNENGDVVRKLKVKFGCVLYAQNGYAQGISGEGVVGMARN